MILTASFYATLIFLAALAGGLLPLFISKTREEPMRLAITFGAGLLLGMAFMHMIPEAAEIAPHSFGYWFMGGFVLLLILERFIMVHACEEHGCHYHTVGVAAFAGLTIHGIMEGFALGSTLSMTTKDLGPLVLVAILSHKVPAGFALTAILRMAKLSKTRITLFIIGVALSGPLGIALSLGLIEQNLPGVTGNLLAFSAGSFLYIGACDLLPEMHHKEGGKLPRLAFFLIGVALSAMSELVL